MKKYLAFILAIVMCFSLCACGSDPVETPSDDVISDVEVTDSTSDETAEDSAATNVLNISDPIIIVDNEYVTFTVKSVAYDELWETYGLKVFMENKTDKPVTFSWDDVSVNGYMCDPFWASEVAAGKKENTEICWYLTSFEENDIDYTQISDIEFKMTAYYFNEETWDSTNYVENVFTLNFN